MNKAKATNILGRGALFILLALFSVSNFAGCEILDSMSDAEDDVRDDGGQRDVADDDTRDQDSSADDDADDADDGDEIDECLYDGQRPDDADRLILLGGNFDAEGNPGRTLSAVSISSSGAFTGTSLSIDLDDTASRIVFHPSGRLAFVLTDGGELYSYRVDEDQSLTAADHVTLPPAGYDVLNINPDGLRLHAVGLNSTPEAGISTVIIGCDGELEIDTAHFYPLILASAMAWIDDHRAVVLGGQRTFDTPIVEDIRLLEYDIDAGFSELFAGDFFDVPVRSMAMAVSPGGDEIVIPNNASLYEDGGTAIVLGVEGDTLVERQRISGLDDVEEAWFSPDGQTLLFTQVEPGTIAAYRRQGGSWVAGTGLTGQGLPMQLALIERGSLAGSFFSATVGTNGISYVSRFTARSAGQLSEAGRHDLGSGIDKVPSAVAVQP